MRNTGHPLPSTKKKKRQGLNAAPFMMILDAEPPHGEAEFMPTINPFYFAGVKKELVPRGTNE